MLTNEEKRSLLVVVCAVTIVLGLVFMSNLDMPWEAQPENGYALLTLKDIPKDDFVIVSYVAWVEGSGSIPNQCIHLLDEWLEDTFAQYPYENFVERGPKLVMAEAVEKFMTEPIGEKFTQIHIVAVTTSW